MKQTYPIVLTKGTTHIVVFIPDFNINTQGKDYTEAIEMARDAIGLIGIDMEDDREALPIPTNVAEIQKEYTDGIISLVDVDFVEYRRKNDTRAVRRNVSLPCWLDRRAAEAGINVSAVLQRALQAELGLA